MLRLMCSLYFEKHILPLILPNREFAYMLDSTPLLLCDAGDFSSPNANQWYSPILLNVIC